MEFKISSSAAQEAGASDCIVSLRCGETERRTNVGANQVFTLPSSVVDGNGRIAGKLDVFKRISSCDVSVDAISSSQVDLTLPCPADPSVGEVRVNCCAAALDSTSGPQKTVEENNYLSAHGVQETLAAAVNAALAARPTDPRQFIADYLMRGSASARMIFNASPRTPEENLVVAPTQVSDNAALALELQQLRQHVSRQDTAMDSFHDTLSSLVRDQPLTFTVLQYNILARYLGNNTEPWLLYGPNISEERRAQILAKHGEKGPDGKYVNVGWPAYVQGILTEQEIKQVEDIHARVFEWSVRRKRLIDTVQNANCDIVAMEEMDEFDDFQNALSKDYAGLFRKRPRRSSKDGCAVFWRKSKFELAAFEGFDFTDKMGTCGTALKDRSCLLVLLRWATARYGRHESRVIVVCTHLARNPEDPSQTKVRARQAAQLMKHLTDFSLKQSAQEVPVVLMGDLNAQHFGEVRGIARTVFQVSGHPCHNFLFRCADVPTGPTSVTDLRKVRIDAVMFQPRLLKILGVFVPHLSNKIPDEVHPSDHVAVRVKFEVKADHLKMQECARSWLECVTCVSRLLPMTDRELKRAFGFFDRDSTNEISKINLQESILELEMGRYLSPEKQQRLLDCFPDQAISYDEFIFAYECKFNSSRMGNIGDLEQAFTFFDSNGNGKVTAQDVKNAFHEIVPIDFTDEEVDDMMAQLADDWKDGLDIHTFCEALCSCNFSCGSQSARGESLNERCQTKSAQLRENLDKLV